MDQTLIVYDNMGNLVPEEYFMRHQSVSLENNEFGIDENPATKSLCTFKSCEKCEKDYGKFSMCAGCRRVRYCSPKCQKEHWSEHKQYCKLMCEVIFTFEHKNVTGQTVYNVYIHKDLKEIEFVTLILDTLPLQAANLHDVKHLIKISTAVTIGTEKGESVLPFRKESNGKYFFNVGKWKRFLKAYIERKKKSL